MAHLPQRLATLVLAPICLALAAGCPRRPRGGREVAPPPPAADATGTYRPIDEPGPPDPPLVLPPQTPPAPEAAPAPKPAATPRPVPAPAPSGGTAAADPGLTLGEYRLAANAVLDGDTFRLEGLDKTIRMQCLDTEEIFHSKKDREKAERDFEAYRREKRGSSPKPVKFGSFAGEDAKRFAQDFFANVEKVRVELEAPGQKTDYYGRYLGHVFALKGGEWVHYNLECVRAGMSPYFVKYGYSRRFHEAFAAAAAEARREKRGIWAPGVKGYADYEERLAWWTRRAEAVKVFDERFRGHEAFIALHETGAEERVAQLAGKRVTVFGVLAATHEDREPHQALLSMRDRHDFAVVCFKPKDPAAAAGWAWPRVAWDALRDEYAYVTGEVQMYKDRPQIVLTDASQVRRSDDPPPRP